MDGIRTILCPVDFSSLTGPELRLASSLAGRFGARVVIQHAATLVPPSGLGASWMYVEEHRREREEEATEVGRRLRQILSELPPAVRGGGVVTQGPLDRILLELETALPAELVVMGTHGPGSAEHRSTTERMILESRCPVLAIRESTMESGWPDFASDARIRTLVPVDFSSHSSRALEYAFDLTRRLPLDLRLFHVDPTGGYDDEEVERRLRSRIPEDLVDRVEVATGFGRPADEILDREEEELAALVVMGTHSKSLFRRLLEGSTAREILHGSRCPVWYVPEGQGAG